MTDRAEADAGIGDAADLVLTLHGSGIRDIPSFYDEINRVFMADVDWQLGESLDALDDLLYGGYGALLGRTSAEVVWLDHRAAQQALGTDATRRWLQDKLDRPSIFAAANISEQLAELEAGTGSTYFDLVLEVFAGHPLIALVLR